MILSTERTIICPLSTTDFDEIVAMYFEPDSSLFIPHLHERSEEEYRQFLEGKLRANEQHVGFWTMRLKADNTFIGTVNLNSYRDTDIIHIGAHLRKKFWRFGYTFEALSVLRDYGIHDLKLPFIHGIFSDDHHASENLLYKLGFAPISASVLNLPNVKLFRYQA